MRVIQIGCCQLRDNHKAPIYRQLVEEIFLSLQIYEVQYVVRTHFLQSHLDFFPANLGGGDNHGVWFHQDICTTESRCEGKRNPTVLFDCYWKLIRETPDNGDEETIAKILNTRWQFNPLLPSLRKAASRV